MKRPRPAITLFLFLFAVAFLLTPALAHPPTDLKIEYNQDTKTLHVEMKHVVGNTYDADHIRRIEVYKNQD